MINDLSRQGKVVRSADYIVIGAGTVGLPVSVMLARQNGAKVVCLESGGEYQDADTHPLNDVVHRATEYGGAAHGRFRCLGGTSSRWGGALIPFQAADLTHAAWPISMDDLAPYLEAAEQFFALESGPYSDPAFPFDLGPDHVNRLAKWPAFRLRNVANVVGAEARSLPNLDLWLNASVTQILADPSGTDVTITARSLSGDEITVAAPRLIIAAGAIETTRLTLLADRQNGGAISAVSPALGCYFSDHISIGVAEIEPRRATALNKIVGFRFDKGGGMRNIRFELGQTSALRASLPPSFVHIGFEIDQPGGFDALREVFRYLQMRRLPPMRVGVDLLRNLPWLTRAVWWRFIHQRLLFPAKSRLVAHVVIEQPAVAENRLTLHAERSDPFGLPLAEIDWRIRDEDIEKLTRTADAFGQMWQATDFAGFGNWKRYAQQDIAHMVRDSGGIFHPTGSTRMGKDATSGVVDRDLKLFSFPQIQLLSTSVLPTGGGANPTMMLFLLAMRCVDQHVRASGGSPTS